MDLIKINLREKAIVFHSRVKPRNKIPVAINNPKDFGSFMVQFLKVIPKEIFLLFLQFGREEIVYYLFANSDWFTKLEFARELRTTEDSPTDPLITPGNFRLEKGRKFPIDYTIFPYKVR